MFYINNNNNNNSSIPCCLVLLNLDLTVTDVTIFNVYVYAKDVPYAQKSFLNTIYALSKHILL